MVWYIIEEFVKFYIRSNIPYTYSEHYFIVIIVDFRGSSSVAIPFYSCRFLIKM
jgi:hypothetical protein